MDLPNDNGRGPPPPGETVGALLTWLNVQVKRCLPARRVLTDEDQRALRERCLRLDPKEISARPVRAARFVTIDTETTGFHAYAGDEIVSVALLELQGLELTGRRYATLIDPDRPIPAASSEIHRVRDEDVRGCPSIREALPDILDFIGDAVLIGHHVGFDLRFLNKNLQKYLLCRLCNPWIDTMLLFTTYTGRMAHYGLDEVAEFCRVPVHGRHTAVGDAQATAEIFAVLAARLIRQAQPVQALIGQQFQSGHEI